MPVFPAVPSTMTPPGLISPFASASAMIASAARSLTEPPGFRNSALPRIVQPVSSEALRSRISGVLPMLSTMPSRMSIAKAESLPQRGSHSSRAGSRSAIRRPGDPLFSSRQAAPVSTQALIRRQIGKLVDRLEHLLRAVDRPDGIALVSRGRPGLLCERPVGVEEVLAAAPLGRRIIPRHLQRRASLPCRPEAIGEDGDPRRHLDDLP